MDAGEVVVHEVKRQGSSVILDFLREAIREPGKAAHRHTAWFA